jgi:hypothetical protein
MGDVQRLTVARGSQVAFRNVLRVASDLPTGVTYAQVDPGLLAASETTFINLATVFASFRIVRYRMFVSPLYRYSPPGVAPSTLGSNARFCYSSNTAVSALTADQRLNDQTTKVWCGTDPACISGDIYSLTVAGPSQPAWTDVQAFIASPVGNQFGTFNLDWTTSSSNPPGTLITELDVEWRELI